MIAQFHAFLATTRQNLSILVASLLMTAVAAAQSNPQIPDEPNTDRPLLALDTGGHSGPVYKLMASRYSNKLISISLDKTIRLWDLDSGEPTAVLRPPVGPGAHGFLFSAALSPDGKLLAVGTYRALTPLYDHRIHLIDLSSGNIVRSLKGHAYTIYDVAFSPDGKQLASASQDNTARIWNVETGESIRILQGHEAAVHGIAWSPDGTQIVTGGLDKTARIWSAEKGTATAILREHRHQLMTVAWSSDGKTIATGCNDKIVRFYEPSGKMRIAWQAPNEILSLKFSEDSQRLLYTYGSNTLPPIGCRIIDVAKGTILTEYKGHKNSPICSTFLPDKDLVATGDSISRIHIWNAKSAATVRQLDGRGQSMMAAGWSADGQAIGWGTTVGTGRVDLGGPLERTFCLKSLDFGPPPDKNFVRSKSKLGNLSMGFNLAARPVDPRTVFFMQGNAKLNTYTLPQPYDQVRCYTLVPGIRAIVGTHDGAHLVDIKAGASLKHMTDRGEELWNLAPSPDFKYVLTAGNDQVLRVWSVETSELLLALFVAGEEWIAWTPQGYYAASLAGESLMGWHLNRGPESISDFYPAAHFHKSLYRPDVIRRVLETGELAKAIELADRERNNTSQVLSVSEVLPADVKITEPTTSQVQQQESTFKFKAELQATGKQPLTSAQLVVDGRPFGEAKAIAAPEGDASDAKIEQEWTIELPPGMYNVAVRGETAQSYAISPSVEVTRTTADAEPVAKPKLYVLGIGATAKDKAASEVIKAMSSAGKQQFGEVITKVLTAEQATPSAIQSELAKIAKEATIADTTLIYYSGQETIDKAGHYRLAASRVIAGRDEWLSDHEFKKQLSSISGKLLLTIDTIRLEQHLDKQTSVGFCGTTTTESDSARLDTAANDFLRELLSEEYGIVVMRTARRQSAGETSSASNWFSQAFTEAIGGKADDDSDGVVQLHEVSRYVNERVRELSGGKQTPIVERPRSVRTFPLSRPPAAP